MCSWPSQPRALSTDCYWAPASTSAPHCPPGPSPGRQEAAARGARGFGRLAFICQVQQAQRARRSSHTRADPQACRGKGRPAAECRAGLGPGGCLPRPRWGLTKGTSQEPPSGNWGAFFHPLIPAEGLRGTRASPRPHRRGRGSDIMGTPLFSVGEVGERENLLVKGRPSRIRVWDTRAGPLGRRGLPADPEGGRLGRGRDTSPSCLAVVRPRWAGARVLGLHCPPASRCHLLLLLAPSPLRLPALAQAARCRPGRQEGSQEGLPRDKDGSFYPPHSCSPLRTPTAPEQCPPPHAQPRPSAHCSDLRTPFLAWAHRHVPPRVEA